MNYKPDTRPVAEGDDIERPIRVILFGGQFVSTDDSETVGLSATGPDALRTLGMRLFQAGFSPNRRLVLYRAGQCIGKTTIGKAAGIEGDIDG